MFKYPMVLSYFSRFFNEARKFGGIITGITQNSVAMLRNPEAETIVLNSDYIMLLKQSHADRQIWEQFVDLSNEESECIGDACRRGDGLLLAGAARVPITGNFPTDNAIYKLFSTDPNEKAD
jgi:type IV secretory pathway VirB4 component